MATKLIIHPSSCANPRLYTCYHKALYIYGKIGFIWNGTVITSPIPSISMLHTEKISPRPQASAPPTFQFYTLIHRATKNWKEPEDEARKDHDGLKRLGSLRTRLRFRDVPSSKYGLVDWEFIPMVRRPNFVTKIKL